MAIPFGVDWDDLDLPDVIAYFDANPDESLLVEAKGTDITPRMIVKQVGAFANSDRGGYLVLGAEYDKRAKVWTVNGWVPNDEPRPWISNIIRTSLDPRPAFDVLPLTLSNGNRLAVVRIWPVSIPPCITNLGEVYERLPGQSVPIKDSAAVRRLFDRGQAALDAAARISQDGLTDMAGLTGLDRPSGIVVSLASPAMVGDASARVFRKATVAEIERILKGPLANRRFEAMASGGGVSFNRLGGDSSQHAVTGWNAGLRDNEGYTVRVGRHGSVATAVSTELVESGLDAVGSGAHAIRALWEAAGGLLAMLTEPEPDEPGPAYVSIRLSDPVKGATDIGRWTTGVLPSDDELASVVREARRAQGQDEWEPD